MAIGTAIYALATFSDESIDLLHIDGYHTYEAVYEDFHNWLPKVKPGGIILLHDISARIKEDFGVWRFWEEISPQYESFGFSHSFGLGVIRKPGGTHSNGHLLEMLFHSNEGQQARLRKFYVHLSQFLLLKRQLDSKLPEKTSSPKLKIKSLFKKFYR